MKKCLIVALLTIVFLLCQSNAFAKKINIGVLLQLTGPFSTFNREIKNSILELQKKEKISSNITFNFYSVPPNDPARVIATIQKGILQHKNKIIIGPFFPYPFFSSKNFLELQRKHSSILFIIPFYNERLKQSYQLVQPKNTFIIPEPVDSLLLALDASLKSVRYHVDRIRPILAKRQDSIIKQYETFQQKMSEYLIQAIKKWERQRKGEVESEAVNYLVESYIPNTMWFVTAAPDFRVNDEWIKANTHQEINNILDSYYQKEGRLTISAKALKNSGVNGCKSLPCKIKCCPYYEKHNHECLDKIVCP